MEELLKIKMLEIKNLRVSVEGKEILKGVNLKLETINRREIGKIVYEDEYQVVEEIKNEPQ